MNRPDPNTPDSGANQDDAVWLDLVARLEAGSGTPDTQPGTPPASPEGQPPAARPFSDFDPLGLSGAPPVELSARERLARSAQPQDGPAAPGSADAPDAPGAAAGPRDYEAGDEDPFVPEEPPSLAGADPMTVLAWLGAVGGPVALLMSAMFWRAAPLTAILGMVVVFAASVIFLIMKLPGEHDEHDDGARV